MDATKQQQLIHKDYVIYLCNRKNKIKYNRIEQQKWIIFVDMRWFFQINVKKSAKYEFGCGLLKLSDWYSHCWLCEQLSNIDISVQQKQSCQQYVASEISTELFVYDISEYNFF